MLILLPPSESKSERGEGRRVRLGSLVAPRLGGARERVLRSVTELAHGDAAPAAAALRLPPGVAAAALAVNRDVLCSPTRAALDRYTGVLYAALDAATMTCEVRREAERALLVFSGLFGVVAAGDAIPDHRVPVAAAVPGLGPLTPVWRTALRDAMPTVLGRGFAVDLRSTDYAAMWAPTGPLRNQVLQVRVLSPRSAGPPRVISHFSKHGKGVLARALLERLTAGGCVADVGDVEETAAQLGWTTEIRRVVGGSPALDVVAPPPPP